MKRQEQKSFPIKSNDPSFVGGGGADHNSVRRQLIENHFRGGVENDDPFRTLSPLVNAQIADLLELSFEAKRQHEAAAQTDSSPSEIEEMKAEKVSEILRLSKYAKGFIDLLFRLEGRRNESSEARQGASPKSTRVSEAKIPAIEGAAAGSNDETSLK